MLKISHALLLENKDLKSLLRPHVLCPLSAQKIQMSLLNQLSLMHATFSEGLVPKSIIFTS